MFHLQVLGRHLPFETKAHKNPRQICTNRHLGGRNGTGFRSTRRCSVNPADVRRQEILGLRREMAVGGGPPFLYSSGCVDDLRHTAGRPLLHLLQGGNETVGAKRSGKCSPITWSDFVEIKAKGNRLSRPYQGPFSSDACVVARIVTFFNTSLFPVRLCSWRTHRTHLVWSHFIYPRGGGGGFDIIEVITEVTYSRWYDYLPVAETLYIFISCSINIVLLHGHMIATDQSRNSIDGLSWLFAYWPYFPYCHSIKMSRTCTDNLFSGGAFIWWWWAATRTSFW